MENSVFPDYRLEDALLLANATIFFWYSGNYCWSTIICQGMGKNKMSGV